MCDARRDGWRRGRREAARRLIERLLALMPRSRGFRVSTETVTSASIRLPRAHGSPLKSVKAIPRARGYKNDFVPRPSHVVVLITPCVPSRPPKREPRSEQAGGKRAANARTRRSAARAAKHAESGVSRRRREIRLCGSFACKILWRKVLR